MTTIYQAKAAARATQSAAETENKIKRATADAQLEQQRNLNKLEADNKAAQLALEREQAAFKAKEEQRRQRAKAKDEKRKRRAQARIDRQQRWADTRQRMASQLGDNIAGTASGAVYSIALTSATYGQVTTATAMHLPWIAGVGFAAFLEGAAIAAAMTAHRARLAGERAGLAVGVAWGATITAAGVQLWGHRDKPLLAVVMAAATITAIAVLHMRTHAAVQAADRARGIKPRPRFGWRRWLVAPVSTLMAWRADVIAASNAEAGQALSAAQTRRAHRRDRRAAVRTARAYNKAVRKALKKGTPLPFAPPPQVSATLSANDTADTSTDADTPPVADTSADSRGQSDSLFADTSPDSAADSLAAFGIHVMVPETVPEEWVTEEFPADSPISGADTDTTAVAVADRRGHHGEADADTSTRESGHLSEVDADTSADSSTDADTPVADTSADSDANTPKRRKWTQRSRKGNKPTRSKRSIDPVKMEEAIRLLLRDGVTPSARKIANITGYGHTACNNYLQDNKHRDFKPAPPTTSD